jgi:hypothetical protein
MYYRGRATDFTLSGGGGGAPYILCTTLPIGGAGEMILLLLNVIYFPGLPIGGSRVGPPPLNPIVKGFCIGGLRLTTSCCKILDESWVQCSDYANVYVIMYLCIAICMYNKCTNL